MVQPAAVPGTPVRLRDAEQSLWLGSIRKNNKSQMTLIIMFLGLSLQTFARLEHLRLPALVLMLGHLATFGAKHRAAAKIEHAATDAEVRQHAHNAELACIVCRLLAHAATILLDTRNSTFLKMVTMWWMPIGAAKACCQPGAFKAYLFFQNALVLLRCSGDWEAEFPWIVSTLIVDRYLLDWSGQELEARQWRDELKFALERLEGIAEETTKNLFHRFCDATAHFKDDYELTEPAPRLSALLNIHQTQGRAFTSLVDNNDLQRFVDHMEVVKMQADKDPYDRELPDYIQVSLMDSFAKPVPVHVFIACFSGMNGQRSYFIGISESWRPPKIKHKKDRCRAEAGTASRCDSSELSPGSRDADISPMLDGLPTKKPPPAATRRYSPRPGTRKPALPGSMMD
mmetsp:Transcript_102236/g.295806  ORF Transcript_102236/g.295806 Transcript_102236/m.295806 type:complete len:400 (+) Transcript_102236:59-1258(+)